MLTVIDGIEGRVHAGAAVVRGGERHAIAARHRDDFGVERGLAGDVVAPVLAVDRVDAVVEVALGVEAERVADLLRVFAADAGDVAELALNVLAVVVEPAFVEDAERAGLAGHVQPGPEVDSRRFLRLAV